MRPRLPLSDEEDECGSERIKFEETLHSPEEPQVDVGCMRVAVRVFYGDRQDGKDYVRITKVQD